MIIIIDNYDSFTYNLAHLVAQHVPLEVIRNDAVTVDELRRVQPTGILISPGPGRPTDAGISVDVVRELGMATPILGVCLGHQAIGEAYGGVVVHAPTLMHGKTSTIKHHSSGVFKDVKQDFTATRYHSLVVDRKTLPDALTVTAETHDGVIMGIRHRNHPVVGIQFHPESVLTTEGPKIIENWLSTVAEFQRTVPV